MKPNLLRCLLGTVVLSLAGCGEAPPSFRPLQIGDAVPAYAAPRMNGDTLDLVALRGRPVLLNVWATWCAPCRDEMPGLQQLHERYADAGLQVVGVSIDTRGSEAAIRQFAADYGVTFTLLHDAADVVSRRFRTNGVPETFLIDADGRIQYRWIGRFEPLEPAVLERVEAVLPPDAGAPPASQPDS